METRFYQAPGLNMERIIIDLGNIFFIPGYQVQHFRDVNRIGIQYKKVGNLAAIVGMQTALTLTLQGAPDGVLATVSQQKWVEAIQQSNLPAQLLSALDTVVRQQNPGVRVGPIPLQMLPPDLQKQLAPQSSTLLPIPGFPSQPLPELQRVSPPPSPYRNQPPLEAQGAAPPQPVPPAIQEGQAPASVQCAFCARLNAASDTYCAGCGRPLASSEGTCPRCKAPIKPDARFCTNCGAEFGAQAGEKTPPTQIPTPAPAEGTVRVDSTSLTQLPALATEVWGYLILPAGARQELTGALVTVGRASPGSNDEQPGVNLFSEAQANTVSRKHAFIGRAQDGNGFVLTDLNSANLTRIDGIKLTPNVPTPLRDGCICEFGQVKCTFKVA